MPASASEKGQLLRTAQSAKASQRAAQAPCTAQRNPVTGLAARQNHQERFAPDSKKPPRSPSGVFANQSLAVTYSGMPAGHTTIGAERFHFRVRNGIGWFPLAMAARQTV